MIPSLLIFNDLDWTDYKEGIPTGMDEIFEEVENKSLAEIIGSIAGIDEISSSHISLDTIDARTKIFELARGDFSGKGFKEILILKTCGRKGFRNEEETIYETYSLKILRRENDKDKFVIIDYPTLTGF